MKNYLLKTVVCIGAVGLLSAGCSNEDLYDPDAVIQKYENAWEKNFGKVNPNQTWNTATRVTANIDLSNLPSGDYSVRIYTANPNSGEAALLAEKQVNETSSISFDAPQALDYVFVTAQENDRMAVNSYYHISDNLINIAPNTKAVTRADCPTEISTTYKSEGTQYNTAWTDPNNEYNHNQPYSLKFAHLSNVNIAEGDTWRAGDWLDIVGNNGVFQEGVHNLTKWSDRLGTTVEYVTTKEGPITLSLNFGATQNRYKIGYFYYTDNSNVDEATRYVLFDNYNPCDYIKVDGSKLSEDMIMSRIGQSGGIPIDAMIQGSKVSLTYFDEAGVASYDFPANVHIAFFVYKGWNNQADFSNTWNSITSTVYNIYLTHNGNNGIHTSAVTYKYGNQVILGIEDGADWDMNDLLFFVDGNFSNDIPDISPAPTPTPGGQSWILACEDLGNTDDFDFNDIVFSVSHVAGTTEATFTPLAAGGTLEAHIYYNNQDLGEIHRLLGQSDYTITNTNGSKGKAGEAQKITVPADFSMSREMGGFKVLIKKNGQEMMTINAPANGNAPQMICIDNSNDWAWPIERTNISEAYPDFGEWGANYGTNADWYLTNIVSDKVVK